MNNINPNGSLEERCALAYKLREEGLKFTEIGELLGVCSQYARQLYKRRANRKPHWTDGLSGRSANCLHYMKIESRKQALDAYSSGRLNPNPHGTRNYGWKSHKEVAKWLGLPEPQKARRSLKSCPHCGVQLS